VNDARLRELWAAPELAQLPPLLAAFNALAAMLRAQHPTLDHEWTATDPASLLEARALVAVIATTRAQLVAYRRAVGRALRDPDGNGDDLPF
jgi:hypothetical protein